METDSSPNLALYVSPYHEKPEDSANAVPETSAAALQLVENAFHVTPEYEQNSSSDKNPKTTSASLESLVPSLDPSVLHRAIVIARHKKLARESAIRRANANARAAAVYATVYRQQMRLR